MELFNFNTRMVSILYLSCCCPLWWGNRSLPWPGGSSPADGETRHLQGLYFCQPLATIDYSSTLLTLTSIRHGWLKAFYHPMHFPPMLPLWFQVGSSGTGSEVCSSSLMPEGRQKQHLCNQTWIPFSCPAWSDTLIPQGLSPTLWWVAAVVSIAQWQEKEHALKYFLLVHLHQSRELI